PALVCDRWGFVEIEGPGDTDREPPELRQTAVIRGFVADERGNAFAGARIIVISGRWGYPIDPFEPAADVLTDGNGEFEVEVPAGRYFCIATRGMLTSDASKGGTPTRRLPPGKAVEIELALRPGGGVSGTVVTQEGRPVPGARIALPNGLSATSDTQGRFTIEGIGSGPQELAVIAKGMASKTQTANVETGRMTEMTVTLARGWSLRGTITNEQGESVEGATVRLRPSRAMTYYGYGPYGPYDMMWYMRPISSDEQGRFELTGLSYTESPGTLAIEHPDYARHTIRDLAPPPEGTDALTLDVTLDKGLAIAGKVIGPDGGPVVAAKVIFRGGSSWARTTTDANGRFMLDKIISGAPGHVVVQAESLAPQARAATPGRDEAMPWLDFVMEPGHTARGRVIDWEGKPIAGARVTPMAVLPGGPGGISVSQTTGTDRDGAFLLASLPADGVTVDVSFNGRTVANNVPLKIDDVTTIVLQPPGVIRGRVVDADTGEPVTSFRVQVDYTRMGRAEGEVGPLEIPEGWYGSGREIHSPAGEFEIGDLTRNAGYALTVSAEGYGPTRVKKVLAAPRDDPKWPVVIKLGQGVTIAGIVTDPDGGPIEGAEVLLINSRLSYNGVDLSALDRLAQRAGAVQTTMTDAQGSFEFAGLSEDERFAVVVDHGDFAIYCAPRASADEALDVRLEEPGSLVGSAAGLGDIPLAGAAVHVTGSGVTWSRLDVRADGSFEVTRLPGGTYRASLLSRAGASDYLRPRRTETVTVKGGEQTRLDFAAAGGVTVSGRVLLRGEPLANASVSLRWTSPAGAASASDVTGADGEFHLYAVPPGERYLSCHQFQETLQRSRSAHVWVTVADSDITQDLIVPDGSIAGVLTNAAGTPIAGARVSAVRLQRPEVEEQRRLRAVPPYEQQKARFSAGALRFGAGSELTTMRALGGPPPWRGGIATDESGGYLLGNLEEGDYLVLARKQWGPLPAAVGTVRVERDSPTAKDLVLPEVATLRLKAFDAATGAPIKGARVMLCTPEGLQLADYLRRPPRGLNEEGRRYVEEPFVTDADGLLEVEDAPVGDYGAWVVAGGYVAQWAPEVPCTPDAETTVVRLERGGTLTIKAADGLLDGLAHPYAVWRIIGADGDPVFPGGENHIHALWDTGAAFLTGDNAEGYTVALAPGACTVRWELRRGPEAEADEDLICSGETQVEVIAGQGATIVLSAE
ncbi:MAG: carboxypeptidase regulatory-like domain-containing protein, partial [Armatimonadetes bacterium]|nr:carboxypeptidase regulatory-like domain-containing protein [Armatimonadota bacterium]